LVICCCTLVGYPFTTHTHTHTHTRCYVYVDFPFTVVGWLRLRSRHRLHIYTWVWLPVGLLRYTHLFCVYTRYDPIQFGYTFGWTHLFTVVTFTLVCTFGRCDLIYRLLDGWFGYLYLLFGWLLRLWFDLVTRSVTFCRLGPHTLPGLLHVGCTFGYHGYHPDAHLLRLLRLRCGGLVWFYVTVAFAHVGYGYTFTRFTFTFCIYGFTVCKFTVVWLRFTFTHTHLHCCWFQTDILLCPHFTLVTVCCWFYVWFTVGRFGWLYCVWLYTPGYLVVRLLWCSHTHGLLHSSPYTHTFYLHLDYPVGYLYFGYLISCLYLLHFAGLFGPGPHIPSSLLPHTRLHTHTFATGHTVEPPSGPASYTLPHHTHRGFPRTLTFVPPHIYIVTH